MSALTNTWTTQGSNATTNIHEDVSDIVYRIAPTATPFLSRASKAKATQIKHEWLVQDLATQGANLQTEGDDFSGAAKSVTAAQRLSNYCQISWKVISVSGTQRANNQIGRKDELAYQTSVAALELKRDMEYALTQQDVSASADPRKSRGLRGWIADNVNYNGSTMASYTSNTGYSAGTQRAFTEAQLKDVLQQIFTAGGDPDLILLPPKAKQTFSTFTGNATRMDKSEDQKLYAAVDFYVSDFGTIEAMPDRFMAARDAFVVQTDKMAVAYLRPFQTQDLAKTSDADRQVVLAEFCLECRTPKAHGAVYDLS